MKNITLMVVETNRYYHQFLDNSDDGPSSQHEGTEAEMFTFLALTPHAGEKVCHQNCLKTGGSSDSSPQPAK
jgi:hypothetical protein